MDIFGPLPRMQPGNRYILTVVDHFTNPVEAYALQDQDAVTIVSVFVNEFISRFGVPYIIHTDQGANCELHMFCVQFQLLNIKKTSTTTYHPQCVESMDRTLIELLALNVSNPTENWDINLSLGLIAYRSSVVFNRLHTALYAFRSRNEAPTRRNVPSTKGNIHEIPLPELGSQDVDGRLQMRANVFI